MPDPTRELLHRAERIEADVVASVVLAPPAEVAERLGLYLVVDGGAVGGFAAGADVLAVNRIVALGVERPATEVRLDRMLGSAWARGVRRLFVQLAPGHRPAALTRWVEARGGRLHNRWTRLWRATADAPAAGTSLRVAPLDPRHGPEMAAVITTAFGMPAAMEPWLAATVGRPGWRHYGALDGGRIVATGALYAAGGTGWLGFAATLPDARGRGAQGALIARRVADAAALGCEVVVAETMEQTPERPVASYRNMLRLGFVEAYHRPNYVVEFGERGEEA
jgi:hypothetical protein